MVPRCSIPLVPAKVRPLNPSSDEQPSGLQRWADELPLQLTIFGAWMMGFGAAALFEYAPNTSLWFPPAGVTFAAVLVIGLRALPPLWLGCLVVTLLADQAAPRGLGTIDVIMAGGAFALSHTLAYAAIAVMLRRRGAESLRHQPVANVLWFIVAGLVATAATAGLGALSLTWSGMSDWSSLQPLIIPRWIGDFAGLITVAPLLAALLARWARQDGLYLPSLLPQGREQWLDAVPQALPKLAILTELTLISVLAMPRIGAPVGPLLPWLVCLPALLWIAWTEHEATALLTVTSFSVLVAGIVGLAGLADQAWHLQALVITAAVISYLVAAIRFNHCQIASTHARPR